MALREIRRSGNNGDAVFLEVAKCVLCSNSQLNLSIDTKDFESGYGNFQLLRCLNCDIHLTNPMPADASIPKLYEKRSSADFVTENGVVFKIRKIGTRRFLSRFGLTRLKNKRILDYGCGDGFNALILSELNSNCEIIALDFMEEKPKLLLNKSRVKYFNYTDFDESNKDKFDYVICKHVLEHVPDPKRLLDQMLELKRPDGKLIIEVPNFDSIWRKIFNGKYHGIYAPRHINHFNFGSLQKLTEGYFNFEIKKSNTPVIGKSIGNFIGIEFSNTGFIGILLYPLQIILDTIFRSSTTLILVIE